MNWRAKRFVAVATGANNGVRRNRYDSPAKSASAPSALPQYGAVRHAIGPRRYVRVTMRETTCGAPRRGALHPGDGRPLVPGIRSDGGSSRGRPTPGEADGGVTALVQMGARYRA